MTSAIDPTKPANGAASTADVRANFATAKTEIEALQTGKMNIEALVWHDASFLNSWVNYGDPYRAVQYSKDQNNIVRIRGLMKNGTAGVAAFVLPSGYRPAKYEAFASQSTTTNKSTTVTTTGIVIATTYDNTYHWLSDITFEADGS